ncbi:MAG TPA: efflux RND transporter periplasmic adaptor subunit [Thermoanaerobacterales bacterium]|nr:efflux RND transporter periplasmic adaptor subunit [Thermoanaerobacterales bacterium]
MRKRWKIVLGAIIIIIIFTLVFPQVFKKQNVEVVEVNKKEFIRSFVEEGIVFAEQEQIVYSLYNAHIQDLLVKEGENVRKGQLIAVLHNDEIDFILEELKANIAGLGIELGQAQRNLEVVEKNYNRILSFYEDGFVATIELEKAENELNRAKADISNIKARQIALQSQLKGHEHKISGYRIKAPIDGIVADIKVQEKDVVGPQTQILTIFNEKDKYVESKILTQNVHEISKGMDVNLRFKLHKEDVEFHGKVINISPYAEKAYSALGLEEERVKVAIVPEFPTQVNINPGYKVDVEFIIEIIPDVLTVPKKVLFSYEGEDAVFVVKDGKAEIQQIKTGPETRKEIVIASGLTEGDLIILDPQLRGLVEGARVSYNSF